MPLFKKSSSSKIPAVEAAAGYGAPRQGGPGAPAGRQGGPGGAYGGGDRYGGGGGYGGPPPQQQDRFANVKPPNPNLGAGFDSMYGGARGQNGRSTPSTRDDASELEAEYGRGGGYGGDQAQSYAPQDEQSGGTYGERTQEEEEEDEVEAVKQEMRFIKQESLSSTRNALRIAREAEETATNTMLRLGDQSDKIANTERHLDLAKSHASRADDNAKAIVGLNRSIFRPTMQFNKKGKRDAEEARIMNRHIEEREEREATRAEALRVQNRVEQELTSGGKFGRFGGDRFGGGKKDEAAAQKNKLAQRSRYQFEATGSDDELEDELDNNLDEIGQLSGRLNQLGRAMGTEIDEQNTRIKRLNDKASNVDTRIFNSTQRLDRIK